MKINKTTTILVVLAGLLVSALSAGLFLSQRCWAEGVAPNAEESEVEENNEDDGDDADVRPGQAGVTTEVARAAAEAAYPGAKALEVELENGLEVIVDATNGKILGTERDDDD